MRGCSAVKTVPADHCLLKISALTTGIVHDDLTPNFLCMQAPLGPSLLYGQPSSTPPQMCGASVLVRQLAHMSLQKPVRSLAESLLHPLEHTKVVASTCSTRSHLQKMAQYRAVMLLFSESASVFLSSPMAIRLERLVLAGSPRVGNKGFCEAFK